MCIRLTSDRELYAHNELSNDIVIVSNVMTCLSNRVMEIKKVLIWSSYKSGVDTSSQENCHFFFLLFPMLLVCVSAPGILEFVQSLLVQFFGLKKNVLLTSEMQNLNEISNVFYSMCNRSVTVLFENFCRFWVSNSVEFFAVFK